MQTVQFQCGKCGKLMAVSTAHLGTQVHCPHCMEIVQTPAPSSPPANPAPEVQAPDPSPAERDSIFGAGDDNVGDDLFGGPAKPLVEMPSGSGQPASARGQARYQPPPSMPPGPAQRELESPGAMADPGGAAAASDSQLPTDVARKKAGNSMLVPMLMVFLIPYSIFCTGYIVWNLLSPPRLGFDPLERLPDSKPGDGGPKRVDPHAPLPNKLKTSLKQPLKIGDVEVTPLRVKLSPEGNLVLQIKLQNTSADLAFNPLPDAFAQFAERNRRPYTFLDAGKKVVPLYGGYLEWWRGPPGKKKTFDGILGPGEEMVVLLSTFEKYHKEVKSIIRLKNLMVWRVQVRRGFLTVKSKQVSATAVIGVEFTSENIEKDNTMSAVSPLPGPTFGNHNFCCRPVLPSYYGY